MKKHDPMVDEAGLLSDPLDTEDDLEVEEEEEMPLFSDAWEDETDREVATLVKYLAGDLSVSAASLVRQRLLDNRAFREKAKPYLYDWCGLDLDETPESEVRPALNRLHWQTWEAAEVVRGHPAVW